VNRSLVALLLAATLGAPGAAAAAQPEDCPTWFPDLRCQRQGRYEGFTAPMTAPFLFEEPFITTGISAHGVWHDLPDDSVLDGGDIWVLAVQARVAITDRLAFIATKDGFVWLRPGHRLLADQQGFFDISAGFKYALIDMPEQNFILTPSLRFDAPTGSSDVFSGNGDGVAIPAVSWAWGLGDFHLVGDLGGRIPFDNQAESTSIFWNFHFDYGVHRHFVPFLEVNGLHWTGGGDGSLTIHTHDFPDVPLRVVQAVFGTGFGEGNDVVNLGSQGVAGNTIVSLAVGARFPIDDHWYGGFAYEFPVTTREDLLQQRIALNLAYEF
jgi:hypothetical protein